MTQGEHVTKFPLAHWEPVPDKPGYVRVAEMATRGELATALNAHLKANKLEPEEYGFSVCGYVAARLTQHYCHMIAYVVEGGSEGYYVHVGAILREGKYEDIATCKTYSPESGYAIAREAQRFLTAAEWN